MVIVDITPPRYVEEWEGKSPDSKPPQRVKLRVYIKQKGVCAVCTRPLRPGHWDADHVVALVNSGMNRETNLRAVCSSPCHRDKTKTDMAEKAKTYKTRARHFGVPKRRKSRPMPGSRASGWKHTMSGQWVKRNGGTK